MIYVYKNNVIEALQVAASYNFQKKALLNPTGPFMWIFTEDRENIFEDTGLLKALQANQIVFNKYADHALWDLLDAMSKIDKKLPDTTIVDLPAMQIVRQKAAKALKLIEQSAE